MRINRKADDLYDCDYLMFKNNAFGDKWFYAFINEVNYINNVTCEIVYELDVIQTWFFDFKADECFIEREHTSTDKIGDHIEPEPVALGEYVYNQSGHDDVAYGDYGVLFNCSQLAVIVAIVDVANDGATSADGQLYDGIYGGATLYSFDAKDVTGINALLNQYTEKPDAIVGMYTVPYVFLPSVATGNKIPVSSTGHTWTYTGPSATSGGGLDGYTPKNNKMYTYPYNFYNIDNAGGKSLPLRFEFFKNGQIDLLANCTITQPVEAVLRPRNYKGSGNRANNSESISLTNFPMCSWNMDAYQAWVAQNSIPMGVSFGTMIASHGANIAMDAALGNVTGVMGELGGLVGDSIGTIGNVLSQNYTASITADISRGQINNGGANVSAGKNNFYGGRMCVNHVCAKMIDNFFSMYGYGVKITGIPNRNARPHFTYCKTVGCTIHGSIPNTALKKISAIYNKGITWWKNPDEVGDYKLDNAPS